MLKIESLANKYRPMKPADMVGNEVAKGLMEGFFKTKKLPPALLFTGGYGQGKTTGSRMLARMVQCESHTVCGTCFGCLTPLEASPNFKEANMASEGGVNDARALIDQARIAPLGGGKRIFLLDECFPAGTEVLGVDDLGGSVTLKIEEMENYRGRVMTFNTETGEVDNKHVTAWANQGVKECVRVKIVDGGEQICSINHPWWSVNQGAMVPAGNLQPGDVLQTAVYGTAEVESVEADPYADDLFDITVEEHHNFFIRPAGTYQWVLVSNCHKLTGAAASALLKTLEEPPANTLWLLATNMPEKMLDTMRSRCVRIKMEAPTPMQIAKFLANIAKSEGCKVSRDRHLEMFKAFGVNGGGHVRSSIQMLQAYLALSNNGKDESITAAHVLESYGNSDEQKIDNMVLEALVALAQGNAKALLKQTTALGEDTRAFLYKARFFIDLKIANFAGAAKFYTPNHKLFDSKVQSVNPNSLILLMNRVQQALIDLEVKFNSVPGLDERIGMQTALVGLAVQFAAARSKE